MATQYTSILKLALPVTGELSGTWGDVVNNNITSMIEQAIAGLSTINTWTANAHTLTVADGTTSESRCAMLVAATGAGGTALTAAGEIICPAASKLYVLKNGAAYAVTLKTAAGTGVAVPAGDTAFLFCDGTNVNACVTTIVNGHISGNLTVDGNTTLGDANTDTVTVTAQFASDLLPSTDNARDLGSTAKSWRTLYCDTSVLVGNLSLAGNTLSSTDTNGNIVIAPNGTGDVQLDADTVRVGDSNANATITTNGTGDLILNTNAGTNSGSITIEDGVNGNIVIAPNGTGQVQLSGALDVTDIEVTNIKAKDGTAALSIADSTGVVSVSANPVLSGGTANGVLYLNASKVATSGTALTFDGTVFSVNGGANGSRFAVKGTGAFGGFDTGAATDGRVEYAYNGTNIFYTGIDSSSLMTLMARSGVSLAFGANGSEGMRLVTGGKLNIGGNFTSTNNTLQVTGNAAIGYTAAAPTTGLIVAGNVGVGTDAPAANVRLHVYQGGAGLLRLENSSNAGVYAEFKRPDQQYTLALNINNNGERTFDLYDITNSQFVDQYLQGASGYRRFFTNGTERMRLDSSGNLGLGVTPSAWASGIKALQLGSYSSLYDQTGATVVGNNFYNIVSGSLYLNTAAASAYVQGTGQHIWYNAPSGTANTTTITNGVSYTIITSGNQTAFGAANNNVGTSFTATSSGTLSSGTVSQNISFTQAMTLDASGNLLVGETSASAYTPASSGKEVFISGDYLTSWANNRFIGMPFNDGANYKLGIELDADSRCVNIICKSLDAGGGDRAIKFFTGQTPTQAMTLDASGNLGLAATSVDTSAWGASYPKLAIGTATSAGVLQFQATTAAADGKFLGAVSALNMGSGVTAKEASGILFYQEGTSATNPGSNIRFLTRTDGGSLTERARITSGGQFAMTNDGTNAAPAISFTNDLDTGIFRPTTNQLGFATAGVQAMTLDASGNLGVGTTSPSRRLSLNEAASTQVWTGYSQAGTEKLVVGLDASGNGQFLVTANAPAIFSTNNTERARITSGGDFRVKGAGTAGSTDAFQISGSAPADAARLTSDGNLLVGVTTGTARLTMRSEAAATQIVSLENNQDTPTASGLTVNFSSATGTNTGTAILYRGRSAGVDRFYVYGNGDVQNTNGTYGTISDQKLKQDIVDAGSQWADIKAIRFRKYRMKADVAANPDAPALLGVVAQELEQTSPGLVDEHADRDAEGNDLGTTTKSVKSSILLMKAAVALQEAMARIEKLEAEVAALKGV